MLRDSGQASIDLDPNAESGPSRLTLRRGAFAHRSTMLRAGHYVYKPISPLDAKTIAKDCLQFCQKLSTQIPKSPETDAYSTEGLTLSLHRAKLVKVIIKSKIPLLSVYLASKIAKN